MGELLPLIPRQVPFLKTKACRGKTRMRSVLTASILTIVLAGCPVRERLCSEGEHVVKSIEAPDTGRTCVRDGDPPPEGYEEYPPGQVPIFRGEDR